MFDERELSRKNVLRAVDRYRSEKPKHHPARSAFLRVDGQLLPAKQILRLAFHDLTGRMPASEQLTGGRASVRVLTNLGFDAIYEKPPPRSSRNPEKNARRAAFRRALIARFGDANVEERVPALCVPDLRDRGAIDSDLMGVLVAVESLRDVRIQVRKNRALSCDFYLPAHRMIIEFDERQHFTLPRAASLKAYPTAVPLGFDKERWIALCERNSGG
jgi:hypothetical protein